VSAKLNVKVDRDSPIPYYAQLKDGLKAEIESGNWRPGDLLPAEPELCREFDVSRTVVRQALKELSYEGLIVRRKGKGTFVASPKFTESQIQELSGFYQDMVDLGHTPYSQILRQEIIPASAGVADRLALSAGSAVIQIDRLRFVEDVPLVLVTTYVPYKLCPQLVEADLSHRSLYEFLETECGLVLARGRRTIEAVVADEYQSELLRIEKGAPLILLDSVSYLADDTPIEYYRALHRGDRSRFEVELVRLQEYGSSAGPAGRGKRDLPRGGGLVVEPGSEG
jgi:GntR family transcriptional regulator